jgi:hypothetical protein
MYKKSQSKSRKWKKKKSEYSNRTAIATGFNLSNYLHLTFRVEMLARNQKTFLPYNNNYTTASTVQFMKAF